MSTKKEDEMLMVQGDEDRDKEIFSAGFIPGWIGEGGLQPEPTNEFEGASWSWERARELLLSASKSINPRVAERRNIRMANPAKDKRTSLNTLHASYQMVAPGEFARSHRHTVNAGRFIIESSGAFTTIDGEKVPMLENDILLTPNWIWHGLGNDSTENGAFWIDFLDDPLVSSLKTIFFEIRDENYKDMRDNIQSPFVISWKNIQEMLEDGAVSPTERYGHRVKLDSSAIPTMEIYVEKFAAKSKTNPNKSTSGRLFICVEGSGYTEVDEKKFDWRRGNVIAVPSWHNFSHFSETESILFEINDEPVIQAFGWYREE